MTKILFISRAYLPVFGGIERQNAGIAESLSKITPTMIIANKKGKKNLPFFLPYVTLKSLFIARKYDAILFGDGVLSPIGVFLKLFYPRKRYISIIHGLDITFAHKKSLLGKIYRLINIPALKKLDKLIMVGNETIAEAVKIGIPEKKCVFIPNGLEIDEICEKCSRVNMEEVLKMDLGNKKIIFRGGRFTKHKGTEWFIRNVMPKLPEDYILVSAGGGVAKATAGDENYYPKCEQAVKDLKLENRVKLLLNLKRSDLKKLFNACDLYISPNIKVPGSMEGFGITAIEAAACERVVLASNLEGLKDAIKDGQDGFLLEPENADVWAEKIKELLENNDFRTEFGKRSKKYVEENFTWEKVSKRYLEEIEKVAS
jgi:glycosyltransferase involved in cell wall biosynthesis